jgi:hypothetical protein
MKRAIFITFSLVFAVSASLVFAQDFAIKPQGDRVNGGDNQDKKNERMQLKNQWKVERQQNLENLKQEKTNFVASMKEKMAKDRCAKIQEKIQERESKFGSVKIKHFSVYANLQNRIQKFIDRFKKFDSANPGKMDQAKLTKLTNDFDTLKQMIADFKTSYSDYFSKLETTHNLTCDATEGQFRSSLADTRVYLASVHENAAAIKDFVRTIIIPDLLDVKKDIAQIKGTAGDENENEDQFGDEQGNENDGSDVTPPTVSISSPAGNKTYTELATVTISATTGSKEEISKVEFYDGETLKGSDAEAPFTFDWAVTSADNGTHSWTAKVYDKANPANTGTSSLVNLIVNIGS